MTPETFEAHRRHMFGVAYRMLGEVGEAEDIVQEAAIRALPHTPDNARAFLTTVVTRLALDRLRSAQKRREVYVGPWLPEPLSTAAGAGAHPVERVEALSLACLALLDRLDPAQRAAFLLREVFDCSYAELSDALGRSEVACRKLVSRAKQRLGGPIPMAPPAEAQRAAIGRMVAAVMAGDRAGVEAALTEDVVMLSDGGGVVAAALHSIRGATKVARFLLGLARVGGEDAALSWTQLNGTEALLVRQGGRLSSALCFEVREGKIAGIQAVRHPAKLAGLEVG